MQKATTNQIIFSVFISIVLLLSLLPMIMHHKRLWVAYGSGSQFFDCQRLVPLSEVFPRTREAVVLCAASCMCTDGASVICVARYLVRPKSTARASEPLAYSIQIYS